ncbi:MAG: 30S ribosome-binding factor RbfA [Chloroflexi bacterium]|nr:30S ribosome-binding factor RbfA [Chloroflexota bacterium]
MTQRTDKIDALLREEIGAILSRELSDPAIGFTTVTDVETAPDLSHAQVWISQIGQPAERAASLAALRRAMPYVRRLLGARVRLRRIPELHLRVDETAERGTRVLKLLSELEAGDLPGADLPSADTLPTPVPRLPHEGEPAIERPSPKVARRRPPRAGQGRSIRGERGGPAARGDRDRRPR